MTRDRSCVGHYCHNCMIYNYVFQLDSISQPDWNICSVCIQALMLYPIYDSITSMYLCHWWYECIAFSDTTAFHNHFVDVTNEHV